MINQNTNSFQTESNKIIEGCPCSAKFTFINNDHHHLELNQESVSPCNCPKLCRVSITPENVRQKITQILLQFKTPSSQLLLKCVETWMEAEWKEHRIQMINRISKLKYLHPSLIGENYNEIEKEILIEWRKNTILHGIQLLWNHVFRITKFQNIEELNQFYQIVRALIAHVSFILFEPPLQTLIEQNVSVENRLFNITAVTIITTNREWKVIAQKVIKPHLLQKTPSFSEKFDLQSLKVSPEIIDFENKNGIFQKTAISLAILNHTYTLLQIVGSLKSYRQSMIDDIKANIEYWQTKNEKDDILTCLIYSLVTYKLDQVAVAVQYIRFLLTNDIQNLLRQAKVDCYLTDLLGVIEYLTTPLVSASLEKLSTEEETNEQIISA